MRVVDLWTPCLIKEELEWAGHRIQRVGVGDTMEGPEHQRELLPLLLPEEVAD